MARRDVTRVEDLAQRFREHLQRLDASHQGGGFARTVLAAAQPRLAFVVGKDDHFRPGEMKRGVDGERETGVPAGRLPRRRWGGDVGARS